MSLILYGVPLSPFVRKLRLLLSQKGLDYQLEIIMPHRQPDWYFAINPLGRVPAIKDGDVTLADSSVIGQYLDEQYPDTAAFYGSNAVERARIRWLEKYADYEVAPLATFGVFVQRLLQPASGIPCDEAAVANVLQERLPKHFDYLESQLGENGWLVGGLMTAADIALSCQLGNLAHAGEQVDASRWPGLAALHQRISALPAMQAMLPGELELVESIKARIASRQG